MHETGYCQSVLDVVERRGGGRRVARVGVRVALQTVSAPEAEAALEGLRMAGSGDSPL